ncbi:MAG: hypothetical protein ABTA16_12900, partial [Niallia sp.]
KVLQEKLNPNINNLSERTSMGAVFRQGDRIMQIKNNYDIYWEREKEYSEEKITKRISVRKIFIRNIDHFLLSIIFHLY